MSASTLLGSAPPPAEDVAAAPPDRDTRRGAAARAARWVRRNAVILGLAVAAAAVVVIVAVSLAGAGDRYLDPRSPAPDGARAVARVLAAQGVDVSATDGFAEAIERSGPGTTLLVVPSQVAFPPDRLAELRDSGADLVLLGPGFLTIQEVVPAIAMAGGATGEALEPGCADPDATAAGSITAAGSVYVADPAATADVVICYPEDGDGAADGAGTYAVVTEDDRRVAVIGNPGLLSNAQVATGGHAALALRALGRNETLVWYLPDALDPAFARPEGEDTPSTLSLLPDWVRWAVAQLVLAALIAIAWRSRRFGRLIPERLPAVVRSAETAEGRARLYRQARARDRAAALLRADAARVIGARVGATRGTTAAEVAVLAAPASGRDPVLVTELLTGAPPADDAGLVRLADALDDLVASVRMRDGRAPRPPGAAGTDRTPPPPGTDALQEGRRP